MAHSVLLSSDSLDTDLVVFLSTRYVVEVWEKEGKIYYKLDQMTKTYTDHEEERD